MNNISNDLLGTENKLSASAMHQNRFASPAKKPAAKREVKQK